MQSRMQQDTIDRIVDDFLSGDEHRRNAAARLCDHALTGKVDEQPENVWLLVPHETLDFDYDRDAALRILGDEVTPDRLAELRHGAVPTEEERAAHREFMLEDCRNGDLDLPEFLGCRIRRLTDSRGREVLVLHIVQGYSGSALEEIFHGLFRSEADLMQDLSRDGVVIQ